MIQQYLPLAGIAIVVLGFALRFNPMLVVTVAALATGLLAGMSPVTVISTFGKAFNDNRIIAIVWVVLPVIGLLERYGLQQRAASLISGIKAATVGRLLIIYMLVRQGSAALGLTSVAGHPQTVRPLVAPMALAAATQQRGDADEDISEEVKAYSAATDNVGSVFRRIFSSQSDRSSSSRRPSPLTACARAVPARQMGDSRPPYLPRSSWRDGCLLLVGARWPRR